MLCRAIGLPLYLALTSGEPKQDAAQLQLTRVLVHNSPHLSQLMRWQGARSADASVPGSHEEECGITQMIPRKPRGAWVLSEVQQPNPTLYGRNHTSSAVPQIQQWLAP